MEPERVNRSGGRRLRPSGRRAAGSRNVLSRGPGASAAPPLYAPRTPALIAETVSRPGGMQSFMPASVSMRIRGRAEVLSLSDLNIMSRPGIIAPPVKAPPVRISTVTAVPASMMTASVTPSVSDRGGGAEPVRTDGPRAVDIQDEGPRRVMRGEEYPADSFSFEGRLAESRSTRRLRSRRPHPQDPTPPPRRRSPRPSPSLFQRS